MGYHAGLELGEYQCRAFFAPIAPELSRKWLRSVMYMEDGRRCEDEILTRRKTTLGAGVYRQTFRNPAASFTKPAFAE